METTSSGALAVALLLLVAGAGVAVTGVSIPAQEDQETQADDAPDAAGCDYASLYEETIGSVVAVRANGGLGSGFAYEAAANGNASHFVTNAHVVRGADEVVVQFARGDSRTGEVVGRDTAVDLAVVRVDETPTYVEALSVANETPPEGQSVAALGNPLGLDETITHGIVSGVNRSMPTSQGFTIPNVVQTDAPINPGNSGGPLVTCDGTVVGVNTAGITASRADNVGFAVPSSTVAEVAPVLVERGEYEHAYLGVRTTPVTPQLLDANDFGEAGGVYVHQVPPDSPASGVVQGSTGVEIQDGARVPVGGDLIVAIDGQQIGSGEALSSYLFADTRPGDEVTLTVLRDGERREVEVTLGERPEPSTQVGTQPPTAGTP